MQSSEWSNHVIFFSSEEGDGVDDEREEGLPVEEARALGKVGTKKLRKIQDKAERKAMREVREEKDCLVPRLFLGR